MIYFLRQRFLPVYSKPLLISAPEDALRQPQGRGEVILVRKDAGARGNRDTASAPAHLGSGTRCGKHRKGMRLRGEG